MQAPVNQPHAVSIQNYLNGRNGERVDVCVVSQRSNPLAYQLFLANDTHTTLFLRVTLLGFFGAGRKTNEDYTPKTSNMAQILISPTASIVEQS